MKQYKRARHTYNLQKGDIVKLRKNIAPQLDLINNSIQDSVTIVKLSNSEVIIQRVQYDYACGTYLMTIRPMYYQGTDQVLPLSAIDFRYPIQRGHCRLWLKENAYAGIRHSSG